MNFNLRNIFAFIISTIFKNEKIPIFWTDNIVNAILQKKLDM